MFSEKLGGRSCSFKVRPLSGTLLKLNIWRGSSLLVLVELDLPLGSHLVVADLDCELLFGSACFFSALSAS